MAPPRSLTCVVVNLTNDWSVRIPIRFAQCYRHEYTLDDLLLDDWFPPLSGSLLRRGLTHRRFFCTRWRPGAYTHILSKPYTFLFEDDTLNLRSGVTVVVKHEGFGDSASVMEDCIEGDVEIIQNIITNFRGSNLVAAGRLRRFSYPFSDRRCTEGMHEKLFVDNRTTILPAASCRCGFCVVPNEVFHLIFDPMDMTTLVNFSSTSRDHYNRIVIIMDYRVRKVVRKITCPDFIDIDDIKLALRSTNAIIHGLPALLPLLPDDIAVPDSIFIATPLATRKTWVDLFTRIPHLPHYHFWDNNVAVGSTQLVKVRSVFFLPNDVVVTVQESHYDSAMPVLLSHPTTAMCCGISYGTVFTLYPQHIKHRITDRIFDRRQPPRWYMNHLTKPIQFTRSPFTEGYFRSPSRSTYIERESNSQAYHGEVTGYGEKASRATYQVVDTGTQHLKCKGFNSYAVFVIHVGAAPVFSSSVCGVVEQMWLNDSSTISDNSALYILEISPDPEERAFFIDLLRALDTTVHDSLLPKSWCFSDDDEQNPYMLVAYHPTFTAISVAGDVVIPDPPASNFTDFPAVYKHWNENRKSITPGAYVIVDFHVVYEQAHNSMIHPFLVADSVVGISREANVVGISRTDGIADM
ncbi:hypothetical protein K435DRAFT_863030 [Dendrothele bispora CBS 962.96]|uniref:Uncharacterized protein n=1 Tax=Dendrothele bispora (strain CBS 962.96) TaxID=1314807 RepID=A0A4V4HEP0_DENBC|nr:hypothetical protein K435DRAFT_863030 [Dendrothele bispora CBS 962.96]